MNEESQAPPPTRSAPPRRRWLWGSLTALLLLGAAVISAAAWLWHSGSAQGWLLQAVPGLSVEGIEGRVNGGPFAITRLRWQGSDLVVEVDELHWRNLSWRWRPYPGAWFGLTLEQPQARAIRVIRSSASPPPPAVPLQAPASLRLPLALSAHGLTVETVQLDGQPLFSALGADLDLGVDGGASHRVSHLRLARGDLQLDGELSLGTDGELPLSARLALGTPAAQPMAWQAAVQAGGPLQRLQIDARLLSEAGAALTAQATVTAFAAWPLAALVLQTRDLDLSLLAPGLPQTAISGSAELGDVTAGQPLRLRLALDNARPGPWDAGRLPVRSAHGTLQGRPAEPERLVFDSWVLGLGRSAADGQLALSGRWEGAQLDVQLRSQAVQAAQLDTRAPRAAVDGTVTLSLKGLAVPGSAAASTPRALEGAVKLDLRGRLALPATGPGAPPPLSVRSDVAFAMLADHSLSFELQDFEAGAGAAKAVATLNARRDTAGAWVLKSGGTLDHLDLAAWWPRAGRSDLNGQWKADLQWPAAPSGALLDALRGAAELDLQRSQMSGVPLSARASVRAGPQGLLVDAQLQAAGNRLQLNGKSAAAARAAAPDWRADLQAPALAALAPLLARVPGAKGWLPEAGAVQGAAVATGTWPALHSQGQLQVEGLRMPQGRLAKANLRWDFTGLTLDAPIELDAEMSGLMQAQRRIDHLHASLQGSLREHRLQLEADSPLRPPAWTDVAAPAGGAGTLAAPGSVLQLRAQGRWQPASKTAAATPGAGVWRGSVTTLRAGPRAEGAKPWLAARDLAASVTLDAQSRPTQAQLAPGRIEAFGGALAWQQAQWLAPERPGAAPRLTLEAQLEPLKIAPILARLQPEFGWRGDLVVGGRASVRSGARFDADIVIERQSGDLGLTLADSARKLELTTLRMALAAHDGHWVLSQALVGKQVGVFGGSQTLEAAADAAWPPPQTPLEGGFSLQVGDASIWAPWLPPGWRLGGEVTAAVSLGGRLGAPTATGELLGEHLLVRNIFEGINLKDGSARVTLDSRQAVVEKLHFQGGDGGALDLQGRIGYAGAPQADLKLALDKFRALDRVDRRVVLSGNADLALRDGRMSVLGRFGIDEGLIDVTADDAPSLSRDVVVVGRTDAAGRPLAVVDGGKAAKGALAGTDIDLRLALGDALRLRGRGLDTLVKGQLRITTAADGQLLVRGTVNTAEGTYTAYGQNLAIRRGSIRFTGDLTNPRLDILALRADIDNPVGVIVSGLAIDPRVRLYSDPDLPEVDQLTWLLTGQAPQGQGRDETALLQRAALALLAGDRGASDEGFLQKLGIDQLGVARADGGDTVVTIGKQLSKRLSIAYEKGLSAAGGSWALLYRIAGRTTLRARTGADNSIEVIWSWRWD